MSIEKREDMIFYEEVTLGNLDKAVLSYCLVSDVTFGLFFYSFSSSSSCIFLNRRLERYKRRLNNFIVCMKNITAKRKEREGGRERKGADTNT